MLAYSGAESASAAYQKVRFFGSLDGLRCLCIFLVLWHHRPEVFAQGAEIPRLLTRGFTGVDFFFVLSGFLITTLLLREEARTGGISLTDFYRRRFLRIIPIYFLVVTICVLWWIVVRGQSELWAYVPYYYLFLTNFLTGDIPLLAPMWSLAVEEQYYLIWPAMMLLLPKLPWRLVLLIALIVWIALVAQGWLGPLSLGETEVAVFRIPTQAYEAILLGSLTAITLHHPKGFALAWRFVGHQKAPLVLFVGLIAMWHFLPLNLTGWPNLMMHLTMAALLASIVIQEEHVFSRILGWGPIARIGLISYGLYLWHLFGRHIGVEGAAAMGFEGVVAGWVAMPVYVIASIVIAEMSFRWFESYFLRLKDKRKNPQPSE